MSNYAEIFETITQYVEIIVKYVLPIYIAIGEVFAKIGLKFYDWFAINTSLMGYIIMGIFIILGILGGILIEPREDEDESQKLKSKPTTGTYEEKHQDSGGNEGTYDF